MNLFKDIFGTLDKSECVHCGSPHIVKNGKQRNGSQEYICNNCGKRFNARAGTLFYNKKLPDKDIVDIIYLFFTGYPISLIPPLKKVSETTIRSILRDVIEHFEKFESMKKITSDYIPEAIEVDEIYIKIQGGHQIFFGWVAYDPVNKYIIDIVTGKRDDETLEKLFKKLSIYRGKVDLVLIDGYEGYKKFITKYLGKTRKKPLTGVINKSKFDKNTNKYLTYALFGKTRKNVEDMISKLGIGNEISTALIERLNRDFRDSSPYLKRRTCRIPRLLEWGMLSLLGIKTIHNFVKAHGTLSVKSSKNWIVEHITPAMKAGISGRVCGIADILSCHI